LLATKARYVEAEPLYRRALAIDEASYGPGHPEVARDLNNLGILLEVTNRMSEAEPLYRRGLVILVRFMLMTGHQHPKLETVGSNYVQVLHDLGRTDTEIDAALDAVAEEARESSP
jgi:hypothetical protein